MKEFENWKAKLEIQIAENTHRLFITNNNYYYYYNFT